MYLALHNSLVLGNYFSITIAIILGLKAWKQMPIFLRLILINVFIAGLTEIIGYVYALKYPKDALVFNIYILILMWLYICASLSVIKKRFYITSACVLLFLSTIIWIFIVKKYGINIFANWALVSSSVCLSIIYFIIFLQLHSTDQLKTLNQSLFWICVSIIVYYAANIPIFSMINYLNEKNIGLAKQLYLINIIVGIIHYALIGYGFRLYSSFLKNKSER